MELLKALFLAVFITVVGREGVLASSATREVRCGRQLVSGLFTKRHLHIGYSYIATVPRGACRLNVSEMVPSQNYIALKMVNGSYIMNGEFAISTPGSYDAAGARFIYSRSNNQDNVYANGPLQSPVDIMILYTEPNPNIKYEYFTDNPTDDTSNDIPTNNPIHTQHQSRHHHHRHHNAEPHTKSLEYPRSEPSLTKNPEVGILDTPSRIESNTVGGRKFFWKIVAFSECSRTCGGGLQIGKFKCVENNGRDDREVSPAHCSGTAPPSRRRRCGLTPCPPRWRAAQWSPCPKCGPAHHTRNVGCVQEHAKGITKVSDQKCPLPMPSRSEPCDVPNCDGTTSNMEGPKPDTRRQVRPHVETFRDSPIYESANTTDNEINNPGFDQSAYTHSAAGGWLYTEWSGCVGGCVSGGIQSRGVRCADPSGCAANRAPESTQSCIPRQYCDRDEGQWFTSEWSKCSAPCNGIQVRGVICIGGKGRRVRELSCKSNRPAQQQSCGGACTPSWYISDWGECQGPCEAGIETRTVWCARGGTEGAGGATRDSDCPGSRPASRRVCVPARCSTKAIVRPKTPSQPSTENVNNQRVTRHQNRNGECVDKQANCILAVQARLCHYHYYAEYCCESCRGR